ncbi:MAG: hypothetical protein WBD55_10940 [Dehalococcoidia bacterium]
MDQYAAEALIMFGLVAVIALGSGLARPWLPWAATAMRWAIPLAFVVLLAVVGVWVAACPGCDSYNSYDSTRVLDLYVAFLWGGMFTVVLLGLTWLGASLSALLHRP